MADEPQEPTSQPADEPAPAPRRGRVRRVIVGLLAVVLAIIAGILVSVFTIDLGPSLRARAEREGSKFIERPMHIGRLSAKLTPGVFVIEDLVIEGLKPTDRPFLRAKKIVVSVPWWTAFTRRLIIDSITMTDWDMVVESWENGRHNFPKLTRESKSKGPSRFTTTLSSVVASRGQFTYDDHGTPWSTVARNLNVQVYHPLNEYIGVASFSNGTVRILSYEPFRTDARLRFKIEGGQVHIDHMDLTGDGSRSVVTGDVDLAHWPEQLYQVRSKIDFPTQKGIFFHKDKFTVSGSADFEGTFHLFKKPEGGTDRELKGTFTSPVAGVNDWRFPDLRGSVLWVPDRLEITNATSQLYGGTARFDYRMGPFGARTPALARWDVEYKNVDLSRLTDFLETQGLRLAGRATGRNSLEWPLGKWAQKRGKGEVVADAPDGTRIMTREIPPALAAERAELLPEAGPFNSQAPLGYVPVAGRIVYALDPEWITLDASWAATPMTYVEFQGQTAFGQRSRIPFHVTSLDWQESDRVLAGIMTAFGSPTGAVSIGGTGEFDGVMLDAFTHPRIEGTFAGDHMRAWDVLWGSGRATLAIENSYVFISESVVKSGASEIRADGQFSLGYPRKDAGEEINARVIVTRRPVTDLRHAFGIEDYPVEGALSGEFHLFGKYETPFGFGRMQIDDGVAYGETFERATSALRFEGGGVRLDGIAIAKSTGGVTGAAFVGWDGSYSFNADGEKIPVESLKSTSFPRAPLSGRLQFKATGAGRFEDPRYDVTLSVDDLFAGDEGIGHLKGHLALRGELLTVDEFEVASSRLAVSGSGRIALTPEMDAELMVRFNETSLDPYVRFFEPRLSPFTNAVANGTIRVVGELADPHHIVVDGRVDELDLKLFDYRLRNDGPIELTLDRNVLRVDRLKLSGEGTELQVTGQAAFDRNEVHVEASGDANLGILQGFFRDIRSRGTAALKAQISGSLDKPVFSGSASITDGRLRYMPVPHALESINGRLSFDAGGVRIDDVTARLGDGEVHFGGRIGLNGFAPGDITLTATGEQMRVRFPEGFVSVVDADLTLQGTLQALVLNGTVKVHNAIWTRRIEATPDLFNLGGSTASTALTPAASTFPLRFNLDIDAPNALRIQNNIANLVASADFKLQGTYDQPRLFGHAEVEHGDLIFEGNRYTITRGGIDFFNPSRIEPVFDIEAETRVRLPGTTYLVTIGFNGTTSRFSLPLNSDPPLPESDIISLLLGQTIDENPELRALRPEAARQTQESLLREAVGRLVTNPVSAPVSRLIGEKIGIDTVIAPTVGTESDPLSPSARLILGRRISNRAYLTYARALGTTQREQIIVLEYDQNDRVGWVITQTGDRTFALDFRVRHRF